MGIPFKIFEVDGEFYSAECLKDAEDAATQRRIQRLITEALGEFDVEKFLAEDEVDELVRRIG